MPETAQLTLLDYAPPLAPPPLPTAPPVIVRSPIPERSPKLSETPTTSHPTSHPYTIGDIVEALPRPTSTKGPGITTPFAGRPGIIVAVDPATQRCKVHFGVPNHPTCEAWANLKHSDRPPHIWPHPLTDPPAPVCWLEWRWNDTQQRWNYTGNMGHTVPVRYPLTVLFPALIDPNKVGIRP